MAVIKVFVGYDSRETRAYKVCVRSLLSRSSLVRPTDVQPLLLPHLQAAGFYPRETTIKDGRLWDQRSGAPMSTEFALSRFLVPAIAGEVGYAVFCDVDFLWRDDIRRLIASVKPEHAVSVVKHDHHPTEKQKMDGQAQSDYPRKNWSSLMVFNLAHPAHRNLTAMGFYAKRGLELHGFNWLRDEVIGGLDPRWNHLVGVNEHDPQAGAVHFTLGTPDMPGWEDQPFADEWWRMADEADAAAAA